MTIQVGSIREQRFVDNILKSVAVVVAPLQADEAMPTEPLFEHAYVGQFLDWVTYCMGEAHPGDANASQIAALCALTTLACHICDDRATYFVDGVSGLVAQCVPTTSAARQVVRTGAIGCLGVSFRDMSVRGYLLTWATELFCAKNHTMIRLTDMNRLITMLGFAREAGGFVAQAERGIAPLVVRSDMAVPDDSQTKEDDTVQNTADATKVDGANGTARADAIDDNEQSFDGDASCESDQPEQDTSDATDAEIETDVDDRADVPPRPVPIAPQTVVNVDADSTDSGSDASSGSGSDSGSGSSSTGGREFTREEDDRDRDAQRDEHGHAQTTTDSVASDDEPVIEDDAMLERIRKQLIVYGNTYAQNEIADMLQIYGTHVDMPDADTVDFADKVYDDLTVDQLSELLTAVLAGRSEIVDTEDNARCFLCYAYWNAYKMDPNNDPALCITIERLASELYNREITVIEASHELFDGSLHMLDAAIITWAGHVTQGNVSALKDYRTLFETSGYADEPSVC